jgi:hypothetical protein
MSIDWDREVWEIPPSDLRPLVCTGMGDAPPPSDLNRKENPMPDTVETQNAPNNPDKLIHTERSKPWEPEPKNETPEEATKRRMSTVPGAGDQNPFIAALAVETNPDVAAKMFEGSRDGDDLRRKVESIHQHEGKQYADRVAAGMVNPKLDEVMKYAKQARDAQVHDARVEKTTVAELSGPAFPEKVDTKPDHRFVGSPVDQRVVESPVVPEPDPVVPVARTWSR